jgi:hypothetical protein
MDTSTTQRRKCRHCGHWTIYHVTGNKKIVEREIGEQSSGAPNGHRGALGPGRGHNGDIIYSARKMLTDPSINTLVRMSRYLRHYARRADD